MDQLTGQPSVDLITISYLLSELSAKAQSSLLASVARAGHLVAVIEPGTPRGYHRMLYARDVLLDHGFTILAPCPHHRPCPLRDQTGWCHFSTRLQRTTTHRHVKHADLGYEDEKYAYVASRNVGNPGLDRVINRPRIRSGIVDLDLCTSDASIRTERVTKRQGPTYRSARHTGWGSAWTTDHRPG